MSAKSVSHELPGGLDHGLMQTLLGYNMAQASIPTGRVFDANIGKPLGLSQVEYTTLVLIRSNPEVTGKKLCLALNHAAARMSLILDRLSERGLVARTQSGEDKRVQNLRLTRQGASLVEKALAIAASMEDDLLRCLTKVEKAVLLELLQKVASQRKA